MIDDEPREASRENTLELSGEDLERYLELNRQKQLEAANPSVPRSCDRDDGIAAARLLARGRRVTRNGIGST